MSRDDITQMAQEAGMKIDSGNFADDMYVSVLYRFANLVAAAEREKLAQWMISRGYATGHGDTIEELLQELEWQIAESWTNALVKGVEGERKVIMDSLQKQADLATDALDRRWALEMIAAVAARRNT